MKDNLTLLIYVTYIAFGCDLHNHKEQIQIKNYEAKKDEDAYIGRTIYYTNEKKIGI